jgi:hypothetical protein
MEYMRRSRSHPARNGNAKKFQFSVSSNGSLGQAASPGGAAHYFPELKT